jgi:hypothetical protein
MSGKTVKASFSDNIKLSINWYGKNQIKSHVVLWFDACRMRSWVRGAALRPTLSTSPRGDGTPLARPCRRPIGADLPDAPGRSLWWASNRGRLARCSCQKSLVDVQSRYSRQSGGRSFGIYPDQKPVKKIENRAFQQERKI